MSAETTLATLPSLQGLATEIDLGTTDAHIAGLAGRLDGLCADTTEGYVRVKEGIRECRQLRTVIENHRKALNRSSLDWMARVNGDAKQLTETIFEIEKPLKAAKLLVDEEEKRAKEERERLERERLEAIEQADKAKRKAEEQELRDEIKRQQDAIAKEHERQRIEREELEQMRAELEAPAVVEEVQAPVIEAELSATVKVDEAEPTVPQLVEVGDDKLALKAWMDRLSKDIGVSCTRTKWGRRIEAKVHAKIRDLCSMITIELAKPVDYEGDD